MKKTKLLESPSILKTLIRDAGLQENANSGVFFKFLNFLNITINYPTFGDAGFLAIHQNVDVKEISDIIKIEPKGSGVYHIEVAGVLDSKWSDYLAGMSIKVVDKKEGPVSSIKGFLQDQSALLGILDTLCQWQLPIEKVVLLNEKQRHSDTPEI